MIADAQSLIDRYGFGLRASARVGDLGFAQRPMVEILKALSRGAKLLVMDEPTSSLTVREEETLFATVDQLKASGIGEELVRLSVGIESAADIIDDLGQALRLSQKA